MESNHFPSEKDLSQAVAFLHSGPSPASVLWHLSARGSAAPDTAFGWCPQGHYWVSSSSSLQLNQKTLTIISASLRNSGCLSWLKEGKSYCWNSLEFESPGCPRILVPIQCWSVPQLASGHPGHVQHENFSFAKIQGQSEKEKKKSFQLFEKPTQG